MHNPAHPGQVLQGWLADLGLGVAQTATHLGIGRVTLSRILHGHAALSADVDLRLSEALGTTPGYWLRMQAARDAREAKALAKARPKIRRLSGLSEAVAQDRAGLATPRKLLEA